MLFGAMIIFAITLTKQVSESSKDMLNQHALKVSEENMKERVENIVSLLEQERKSVLDGVESLGITIYQNMYHVKKNGKNSFACYSPEMEKEG